MDAEKMIAGMVEWDLYYLGDPYGFEAEVLTLFTNGRKYMIEIRAFDVTEEK